MFGKRIFIEFYPTRLSQNLRTIRNLIRPGELTWILKADGYGLGVKNLIPTLISEQINTIAFASLEEITAFQNDYHNYLSDQEHASAPASTKAATDTYPLPDIILLGSYLPSELKNLVDLKISIPLSSLDLIKELRENQVIKNSPLSVTLVLDTGMGRVGILPDELEEALEIIEGEGWELKHVYSHLSNADLEDDSYTHHQVEKFQRVVGTVVQGKGLSALSTLPKFHLANSFGVFNYPSSYQFPTQFQSEVQSDIQQDSSLKISLGVRFGIGSYGVFEKYNRRYGLFQVFKLKSHLTCIRRLPTRHGIGYNHTHFLKRPSIIGTVAAGYADGIPFQLGTVPEDRWHSVVILGRRVSIIGKVSMDYITVDLTDLVADGGKVQVGDEVTLLGDGITVEEWSTTKQTHPYDIMTSLNTPRMSVVIKED